MSCQKSRLKKYVQRPGPPIPAMSCKENAESFGNDGRLYVNRADKNGRRSWKPVQRSLKKRETKRSLKSRFKARSKTKSRGKASKARKRSKSRSKSR